MPVMTPRVPGSTVAAISALVAGLPQPCGMPPMTPATISIQALEETPINNSVNEEITINTSTALRGPMRSVNLPE